MNNLGTLIPRKFKQRDFSQRKACDLLFEGAYTRYVTEKNQLYNAALRNIRRQLTLPVGVN